MSYDEEEISEDVGFRISDDDMGDDEMEPLEEVADFGLDEEDPDKDR